MKRMRLAIWVGLLCAAALVLQGCGGGGGDGGVRQDLEAQLEALMAERNAARQAQQTAEAAQTAAEEARAVAETARKAAETARAAAEAERDTAQAAELAAKAVEAQAVADLAEAQAAEMTAKAAQKAAEAARATAEEARATADVARKAAEEARATAETERDAAKAAQAEAVAAQAEAVAAQAEAEAAQAESVAAEMAAKAAQTVAEAARDAAVKAKTAAEAARDESRDGETQAKIDLIAAQSAQALAERERNKANTAKTEAEQAQAAAETARQEAETARSAAETARNAALEEKTQAEGALAAARTKAEQDVNAANTKAEADIAALQSQLDDANENLKEAQDDLKEAQGDLDAANDEFATVKKERDDAVRDLARAEGTLEGLRSQLTEAQQDVVDAEQRRREAEREADRRIEQAETQANVNVRAPLLLGVLTNFANGNETTATVSWMRDGNLEFMPTGSYTRGSAAPSVPGSWRNRASFTRQSGTATALVNDTVYLYSNIQAPGTRAFWKVHGVSPVTMTAGLERIARGSLAQPTTADTNAGTTGRQYDGLTVSGSLGGASGKFTCTTGCSGTVGSTTNDGIPDDVTFSQGKPDFKSIGSWTFKPGSISASYQVNQDDAYLYFGIWVSEPVNVSGTPAFEYIAGGGGVTVDGTTTTDAPNNFDALTGTATFRGGAVGKYATQGQVGQQNARMGTFTATATFTADFETATATGTLAGSITDFREGGSPLADWRVTLGSTANIGVPSTIIITGTDDATGSAVGSIGGVPVGGAWGADFYGSDNVSLDEDRTTYPVTRYPVADLAGVTGWFNATSDTASLAGAFGAACSTGSMCAR